MKKILSLVLVLALMMSLSLADEKGFDGSVYEAYIVSYDARVLASWDVMTYVEPSGLLLSAYLDAAEITVSVEETEGGSADDFLKAALDGVSRYGRLVDRSDIAPAQTEMGYSGAAVTYSYQSIRGASSDDHYLVYAFAAPLTEQYMLSVTVRAWGMDAEGVFSSARKNFMGSLYLQKKKVSTTYTAFLTDCEARDGGIYVTLDYCEPAYDTAFGFVYTANDDPATFSCRLSANAELWLPRRGTVLYTMEKVSPDASAIKACIDDFFAVNNVHAVYQVLFDENGDIIRMQHYNAL